MSGGRTTWPSSMYQASQHQLPLCSTACRPASAHWMRAMAQYEGPKGSPCSAPRSHSIHSPHGSRRAAGREWHQEVHAASAGACLLTAARIAGHWSDGNAFRRSRSKMTAAVSEAAADCSKHRRRWISPSAPPGRATPAWRCRTKRRCSELRWPEAIFFATNRRHTSPTRIGRGV